MPHCGFCGAEIPFDAHFCGSCGRPIDEMIGGPQTGENQTVLSDPRLPRILSAGQPPQPHTPMTPGAPPASGVPSVPGMPPAYDPLPPRLAFTPRTPLPQQELLTHSPQHTPVTPPAQRFSLPQHTEPTSGHQWPSQQSLPTPRYQHIVRTPISQKLRAGKRGKGSKKLAGSVSRWLFLVVLAIVLIISSGTILVFASSPALTLSGSQVVSHGEILHLHGSGFIPGGTVSFTLDNALPLAPVAQRVPGSFMREVAFSANDLEMAESSPPATTVTVSVIGTFDASILVTEQWQSGAHTIHAAESLGSRGASLAITVQTAGLSVSPSSLNFHKIAQGQKVFLPLLIGNTGQQRLNWTAQTAGTAWLSVQTSHGIVDPGNLRQIISVEADTSNLNLGSYTANVIIASNGGQKQVPVSIQVVQQQTQPELNLFPDSLDFGTVTSGQQATLQVAVSNLGGQTLSWQVTAANAGWLTFSQSNGTIKSGGLPQTLYVTANTANQTSGSYTVQLQFRSNGGNDSLTATLEVSAAPTPTPTTTNPPTLTVTPTSLNSDTDCSYEQGYGWLCPVTLGNPSTTQGDLNWSASGSGISGIQFYPSNSGAILPGQTSQVIVFIPDTPCFASATLSFVGPANSVNVLWSCPQPTPTPSPTPQPPVLTAMPTQLDQTQCSSNDGGQTYTCQVTVGETDNSQGDANWYVQSNDQNLSFDPPNGTLSPGGSTQVTISNIPCQNDTFTFSGQEGEQPVTVNWSCSLTPTPDPSPSTTPTPQVLTVTPMQLDQTQCSSNDGGQTYICQVTVGETDNSQGNANWTASGNLSETFQPQQDQLSPGGSDQVTISNVPCQDDTFTFSGQEGEQPVTVSWSCSSSSQNGLFLPSPAANNTRWLLVRRFYALT